MELVIVGAGKQAELINEYLMPNYSPIHYAVEHEYIRDGVEDLDEWLADGVKRRFYVAIAFSGLNTLRARLFQKCRAACWIPISYVHPSCVIGGGGSIGRGVFVCPLNNIDPVVNIGDNVYFHSSNHIGHHSTIHDNVFIASGVTISGMCDIGENTFIGVGASIAHGVKIGARCIIGAGTYINRDIPGGSLVRRRGDKPDPDKRAEEVTL